MIHAMSSQIRQRKQSPLVYALAKEQGYSHLQACLLAARLPESGVDITNLQHHVSPSLSQLDSPFQLPDIAPAAARIAEAIVTGQTICCVSDFDCDGATSQCVLVESLQRHFGVPQTQVKSFISHRMAEGYGITDALVDRILDQVKGPALIITADQGSTDEPRIARLKEAGIDTVVTDHHMIPTEGPPASAVACVNPMRADSQFPDRAIAGVHVAWLTMSAVRKILIDMGRLPADAPTLRDLIDYVALGTLADCMDLSISKNNRALLRYGLWLMNTQPRQCWQTFRTFSKSEDPFVTRDLSHGIAPRINARGRLSEAMTSALFLLETDPSASMDLLCTLDDENKRRRQIQDQMVSDGIDVATAQYEQGDSAIVVFFPEGHSGVHGIVASKYIEMFGRPVVCFSPKPNHPDKLSGSFRSIERVHIRNALVRVGELVPDVFVAMGGHAGAAGATIYAKDLEAFSSALRQAVSEQCKPEEMHPSLLTDGSLGEPPTPQTLAEIAALEPYGRQFEAPVFSGQFGVLQIRPVGDGRHLKLMLKDQKSGQYEAIWFGALEKGGDPLPIQPGDSITAVYEVKPNTFRGRTNASMVIRQVTAAPAAIEERKRA